MERTLDVANDGLALHATDADRGTLGHTDGQLGFVLAAVSGDIDSSTADADVAATDGDATASTDDDVGSADTRLTDLALNGQDVATVLHVDTVDFRLGTLDGHGHLVAFDDGDLDVGIDVADVEGLR